MIQNSRDSNSTEQGTTTGGQVAATRRGLLFAGFAGLAATLAGCSSGDGGEGGGADDTATTSPPETPTETPTQTATQTPTLTPTQTESKEAVVRVGPDDEYVFNPGTKEPLEVTTGTTVRFVWRSGGHNIVVENKPQKSDWNGHESIESRGFEHTHTFDMAGEYRYYCEPHRSLGMKGRLVVS